MKREKNEKQITNHCKCGKIQKKCEKSGNFISENEKKKVF